jgi:DNA polymerase zeta
LQGRINFKEFIIAKEIKFKYKSDKYIPPSALVGMSNANKDPLAAPKYKERVKYLVISGGLYH